jgi:hypothetical protein
METPKFMGVSFYHLMKKKRTISWASHALPIGTFCPAAISKGGGNLPPPFFYSPFLTFVNRCHKKDMYNLYPPNDRQQIDINMVWCSLTKRQDKSYGTQ